MEQLQHMGMAVQGFDRGDGGVVKGRGRVGALHRFLDFGQGVILQKDAQHMGRPLLIAALEENGDAFHGNLGEHGGNVKPSIMGQAPQDGLGRGYTGAAPGREKRHALNSHFSAAKAVATNGQESKKLPRVAAL